MAAQQYDAIVVGSGISGGWAAKELTQKGLKVLMLERGRNIEHIKDYVNADKERVDCFGESYSLDLKSDPKQDTIEATKQIFGIDACLKLLGSNGL